MEPSFVHQLIELYPINCDVARRSLSRIPHRVLLEFRAPAPNEHTDRETGQLVYELYGLSDKALVEGATV
jgi:hypothetical protein